MDGSECKAVTKTISNCQMYSAADTCKTCKLGYFLVTGSDNSQSCQSISKASNCWRYSLAQCDECKNNKVMNRNFFLDQEISSTVVQANVQIAKDELVLSAAQGDLCVTPSDPHCTSTDANTGECLECSSGYYLNSSKVCVANPEDSILNCGEYSTAGTCSACTGSYYLSQNACLPVTPVENCMKYQVTTDACLECQSEYYVSGTTCEPRTKIIIPGCGKLSLNGDSCGQCKTGFNLSTDSLKCFQDIENCIDQLEDNAPTTADFICTKCNPKLYPSTDGSECLPQYVANCSGYTDQTNTCTGCNSGFNLNGGACEPLNVPNCKILDSNNVGQCSNCHPGYYVDSSGNCKMLTVQNCKEYEDKKNECKNCTEVSVQDGANTVLQPAFYLKNGECLPYDLEGCSVPNLANNFCDTCDKDNGFYKITGTNICKRIPMIGCKTYDFSANQCTDCDTANTGYFLDSFGVCQRYSVKNCATKVPDNNYCATCNKGFYLKTGVCIPFDLIGCDLPASFDGNTHVNNECYSTTCEANKFYKVLDSNGKTKCFPFTIDTEGCDAFSGNKCTSCKINGCDQNTGDCATLYYLDPKSNQCFERTLPGCKELLKPTPTDSFVPGKPDVCHECLPNYYLDSATNTCHPYTLPNCLTYSPTADECATCDSTNGYVFNTTDKTCVLTNLVGCVEIKTDTDDEFDRCKTCAKGFKLSGTSDTPPEVCSPEDPHANCAAIDESDYTCDLCVPGFYLSNDICTPYTAANIKNCVYPNPIEDHCLVCEKGYKLIDATAGDPKTGKCTQVQKPNCYDTDDSKCISCMPGYKLSGSGDCDSASDVEVDEGCLYSSSATGKCDQCKNGMLLVTRKFKQHYEENCQQYRGDGTYCNHCDDYFYRYATTSCTRDSTTTDCIRPNGVLTSPAVLLNNTTDCAACVSPNVNYLDSNECKARDTFLSNCENYQAISQKCETCKDGYNPYKGKTGGYGVCQKKIATNDRTFDSTMTPNCGAYKSDDFTNLAVTTTDENYNCKICNITLSIEIDNDKITQSCAHDGITDISYIAVDRNFDPVQLTKGTNPRTSIANCVKHIFLDDLTQATATQVFYCEKCASTHTGSLKKNDGSGDVNIGNPMMPNDEPDITANNFLFEECINTFTSQADGLNATTSLTNCDVSLQLKDLFGHSSKTAQICMRCKPGFEPNLTSISNYYDTTAFAGAAKVKHHIDCMTTLKKSEKKYKGLSLHGTNDEKNILNWITNDSCKNGENFGVLAKFDTSGNYWHVTDTSNLNGSLEICSFNYNSIVENCQVNLFDYNGTDNKYSQLSSTWCGACKPGYKMSAFSDNNSCTLILNCDLSDDNNNTWLSSCQTCKDGFTWEYDTDTRKIEYSKCVSNQGKMYCDAIQNDGDCAICTKGFDVVDGDCISQIDENIYCKTPGYPLHTLSSAYDAAFTNSQRNSIYYNNLGYFNMHYRTTIPIYGCAECDGTTDVYLTYIDDNSTISICQNTTTNKELIPNCESFKFLNNYNIACTQCEDGYVLHHGNCVPYNLDYPGCLENFGSTGCSKCSENYKVVSIENIGYCIESEYIMNNYDLSDFNNNPIFKEGFRPTDYQNEAYKIIPIEDENPCLQYLTGFCIKCKEPNKIPLETNELLAYGMKKIICIHYEQPELLYPNRLVPDSILTSSFSLDSKLNIQPGNNIFILTDNATNFCIGNTSFDPLCEDETLLGCTKCQKGYYVESNKGDFCKPIPINNCLEYNGLKCTLCEDNYFLDIASDYACAARTKTSCKEFSPISDQCLSCQEMHYIGTNGVCTKSNKLNCVKLNMFGDYCLECTKGFYINNGTCTQMVKENCKSYFVTTDVCGSCDTGFYLSDGKCLPHTALNCLTKRSDADFCESCPEGLYLDELQNCSLPDQNNCAKFHPFEDKCNECSEGYYLKDGDCLDYNVKNCKVFNPENDSCLQCPQGLYLDNNGTLVDCFAYTVTNCAVADPFKDKCLSCEDKHYNINGKCLPYSVENCNLFDPFDDICLSCEQGFVLGTNSQCLMQSAENCATFYNHVFGCLLCNEGYYMDKTNNSCSPYTISKCQTFSRDADECLVCSNDTYLDDKKCKPYKATFCNDYHPYKDQCLNCREGYYLDDNSSCQAYVLTKCVEKSNNNNKCTKCEEKFYLDANSMCQQHTTECKDYDMYRDKCLSCSEGMHLDINRQCKSNMAKYCKSFVENKDKCLACEDDKWMDSEGLCHAYTAKNCKTLQKNNNLCDECISNGYYKNTSGSCIKNTPVENCEDYSTTTDQCSKCKNGYYKFSSSECRKNPTGVKNCVKYQNSEICNKCKNDYYLKDNVCYETSTTVSDCEIYVKDGICGVCASGKVLNFNNECITPLNSTCLTHQDSDNCATCDKNQVIKSETTGSGATAKTQLNCVDSGITDCLEAEASGSSITCKTCENGFILSNNKCQTPATSIPGCLKYAKEGECMRCEDDKILSADKKSCDSDMSGVNADCLTGHFSEKPQCYQCQPGYRFDSSGDCEKCGGDGCDICSSDGKMCKLCAKGYYMTTQLTCHAYPDSSNRVVEDQGVREQEHNASVSLLRSGLLLCIALILGKFM